MDRTLEERKCALTTKKLAPGAPLSEREMEVLIFLGKGCTNKEIGALLKLSEHTISDHVKHIYIRLEVQSRVEAAVWAAKAGLL